MGTGGRLPDLADVAAAGTQVKVVEPGSPEDTLSHQASLPAQVDPSAPAGAPTDQGGEGKGDVINPANLPPARPVLAPPPQPGAQAPAPAPAIPAEPAAQDPAAPAAPVAPVEGQPEPAPAAPEPAQPASVAVPAGVAPPATPAEPAPAPATPEVTAQPTAEEIREEAEKVASVKIAAVQSGVDKRMNTMQTTQDDLVSELERQKQNNRDLVINGIPEDQRSLKLQQWELDDAKTEVERLRKDALSYGTDVELASLLIDFRDVPGVTEDDLAAVPIDERDIWCMTKRTEHLREQLKEAQNGHSQATPEAPAQVLQPAAVAVPAGAQAPSDVGGAGTAPPPGQPTHNPDQSREAMTENMGSGWEVVKFPR